MRNNKSLATLSPNLAQSLTFKQLVSPTAKKVEGFDRSTLTQAFSSKVDKLRTKPKVQALQDQYIGGLQDEIKYLQMELKLLQQKDLQRHGQIDQLEKFFGDGIPINENILAIKNGFNNYKQDNQKKIKELSGERNERTTLIDGLAQKVEQLLKDLNDNEKGNRGSARTCQEEWYGLVGQEAALKKRLEKQQDQLKTVRQQSRKLFQKIEKVTRNKLIENITVIKQQNSKMNKLNGLKQGLVERNAQLLDLQKQYADLVKEQQEKSYLIRQEQDNLAHRKKVIIMERQSDNLRNKIKQRAMQLEQRLKERMTQIAAKMDIRNRVDDLREEINKQNSITIECVAEIARGKEIDHLKKIVECNKTVAKYTDHYSNILTNIENSIQNLAQRKPQAKSQLHAYSQELLRLRSRQQAEKEREVTIHAELVQLQEQFNDSRSIITPLQERYKKSNEQTQAYLEERSRLIEEIKIKEKQLELIFVLKGLNFEETEISKTSNRNIQDELVGFLKNWQKIQRAV